MRRSLARTGPREDRPHPKQGRRPPYDAVLMFKVLVLQTLYTLADDQTEYQLKDRLSFMRFVGLALEDRVPDAKTIWLYREQLTRAGAVEHLFARFDAALRAAGYLAMGGQIVDATVIEARRPRLSEGEKATVRAGGVPAGWGAGEAGADGHRRPLDDQARVPAAAAHRRVPGAHHHRDRSAGVRLQEPPRD
jgi:transposase, IS5 family